MTRRVAFLVLLALLIGLSAALAWAERAPNVPLTPQPWGADSLQSRPTGGTGALVELHPGFDYAAWFTAQTGEAATPYFAAYVAAPLSDTLYLGFGSSLPADLDGSLFASSDGVTLTAIYTPTEQGFIGLAVFSDTIYFPGPDPADVISPPASQWDWGNFYAYTAPGPVQKFRNLPRVIHMWGVWADPLDSQIYVATSAHTGDYKTWTGEVFSTTNGGGNWTLLADSAAGVGAYRTYDIIGFAGKLYVTWNDVYGQPCGLAASSDGGATWARLPELAGLTACRTRLALFNDTLLALNVGQTGLYAIDAAGAITEHIFPNFQITDWAYNYLAAGGDGYLYTVADNGRLMRSADLVAWQTIASTDRVLVTVGAWPARNLLIAGDRGDARLWQLDLAAAVPITIPQAPQVTISATGGLVRLDWPDVTLDEAGDPATLTGYRVYSSTVPYFDAFSYSSNLVSSPTDSEFSAAVLGDPQHHAFYLVRAEDSSGALSTRSQRVGKFEFELTPGG